MKTFVRTLAVLVSAAAATTAVAKDRAPDAAYLAAARCQGLARAAGADTSNIDAFLKAQRTGRESHVQDQAADARRSAEREYRSAGVDGQRRLQADSRCVEFTTRLAAGATASRR